MQQKRNLEESEQNASSFKRTKVADQAVHIETSTSGSEKISDKDLLDVAKNAKLSNDDLRVLYTELDLEQIDIEKAKKKAGSSDFQIQSLEVLLFWRKSNGKKATRKKIISTLTECTLIEAKDILEDKWRCFPEVGDINKDASPSRGGDINKKGSPSGEGDINKDGSPSRECDVNKDGSPSGECDVNKDGTPSREGDINKDGSPSREGDINKDGSPLRECDVNKDGSPSSVGDINKDDSPQVIGGSSSREDDIINDDGPFGESNVIPLEATSLCSNEKALEMEESEDIKTHKDAYQSSGEGDVNEGGAPSQDDTNISRDLNNLDGEEKDGLRSPFQQPGSDKQLTNKASTSADDKPTELYEDQLEVALPAIEGKNALILMPTGAGKTVVAASVIEKVINDSDDKMKCKVIFMVPTGPLVKQQQERLEERLRPSRNFHITGLKGDTMKIPLKAVLEAHNVIVLTAAILDTALKDGDNLVELESLALLVFDECHHCMKDHVYNTIMKRYKYEMFEHPSTKLPQIVGLTATTGTGKAKSQIAAEDHVFQLICNLDTPHISVVERNKNKLQERINLPEEVSPICVDPRKEDPFKTEVCKIMCDIENIMKDEAESSLSDLSNIPNDKRNPSYMQWLSSVEKESGMRLDDGDRLRVIRTCVKNLKDYHISLGINAEVRTKDAYDYLNLKYTEMSNPEKMEAYNDTDSKLLQMFMAKRRMLRDVSNNPKYGNPLLATVADIIVREYKQTPTSRALLFCQTVEATKALKTWIEETDSLRFLCPNRMVGGKGMTSAQHQEILDRFHKGKHKLLVCTNVLEEGLDVAACNLVMRLNYVPSDTGHVQSRGRGRAKNSKSYLIASSECNHAAWEYANKARSGMSQRAVESIRSLPIDELKDRMLRRQKEDYNQHKLEAQSAQDVRPRHAGEFQLLCGGCRKFACATLDIGVFNGSQHIVLDEQFLGERSALREHPRPKTMTLKYEFSKLGKVDCKECNHNWGILAGICDQKLPIIKISAFIIEKEDDSGEKLRYQVKKWIDAKKIFPVKDLTREELQTLKKMDVPEF